MKKMLFMICISLSIYGKAGVLPKYFEAVSKKHHIETSALMDKANWVDDTPWPWVIWKKDQSIKLANQYELMKYLNNDRTAVFGIFKLNLNDFQSRNLLEITNPINQANLVASQLVRSGQVKQTIPTLNNNKTAPYVADVTGDYSNIINLAAKKYNVDPLLIKAMIKQESAGKKLAVSNKGARGLMQIMPATGRSLGVSDPDELFDPTVNIHAGTKLISQLIKDYKNTDLALAAYNAGSGAVNKYGGIPPYKETQIYIAKIKNNYRGYLLR